jgi:hypothetical protein
MPFVTQSSIPFCFVQFLSHNPSLSLLILGSSICHAWPTSRLARYGPTALAPLARFFPGHQWLSGEQDVLFFHYFEHWLFFNSYM